MAELKLFINGQPHGFISANLTFSIEQLAHTFNCTILPLKINGPLPVTFTLDGQTIFTGQIDGNSINPTSTSRTQTIVGRSVSAHMIDSRLTTNAIYNQRLDSLLKTMAAKFGLSVQNNVKDPLPLVPEFQINAESPFQNLAQIAKQQGLMLFEYNGKIIIEKPGQFQSRNLRLEEGENLSSFSIQHNWSTLFNRYEIQGAWDDAKGVAINQAANAYRQKVVVSDKLQNQESCQARAQYEHDLAIAKSLTVNATLGNIHTALALKALNKTLQFKADSEGINEQLLVKSITLNVTGDKQSTSVSLMRPFAEVALK